MTVGTFNEYFFILFHGIRSVIEISLFTALRPKYVVLNYYVFENIFALVFSLTM